MSIFSSKKTALFNMDFGCSETSPTSPASPSSNSLNFPRAEARCLVPQHLPRLQGIGPRAEAITPFTGRPLLRYVILLELLRIWVENDGKRSNLRHQIFRVVFSLS